MKTLTITEIKKKQKNDETDDEFIQQILESLEDVKRGRLRRVA